MITYEILRFFFSFCSGVLLSLSGGLVQGVTHNELSGPSTLGMEGISVVFIIFALILKISLLDNYLPFSLEMISFLLFFLFWLLSFLFLRRKKQNKNLVFGNRNENKMGRFLLMGLCFNLFIGAFFSVIHFLFMNMNLEFPSQIWFGNFRFIPQNTFYVVVPLTLLIYFLAINLSKKINFLIYGNDFALGHKVEIEKVQFVSMMLSLLAQGIVVSYFGIFAFLAIIFPHILRGLPFFKSRFDLEIKYGSILAGLMMMGLDMICYYNPVYGAEIPVGMLSSVAGPFFLMVLVLKRPKLFVR